MSRSFLEVDTSRWLRITILAIGLLPLAFGSLASAQEPPSPEKKDPAQETPEKPDASDELERMLDDLEKGQEENPIGKLLDDIQDNLRTIEKLLNQKETGAETQGLQGDTVQKIDKLIEEAIKAGAT